MTILGLNRYEAMAYYTLVTRGKLTAAETANNSGIPRPRIYDILNTLEKKGVVLVESVKQKRRPKHYRAISPDNIVEMVRKRHEEKMRELNKVGNDITKILIPLYNKRTNALKPDEIAYIIRGAHNINLYLEDMLRKAENHISIYMSLNRSSSEFSRLCSILNKKLRKGVKVNTATQITPKNLGLAKRLPNLRHLNVEPLIHACFIDGKKVMITTRSNTSLGHDMGLLIENEKMIASIEAWYSLLWNTFEDADKVIAELE